MELWMWQWYNVKQMLLIHMWAIDDHEEDEAQRKGKEKGRKIYMNMSLHFFSCDI